MQVSAYELHAARAQGKHVDIPSTCTWRMALKPQVYIFRGTQERSNQVEHFRQDAVKLCSNEKRTRSVKLDCIVTQHYVYNIATAKEACRNIYGIYRTHVHARHRYTEKSQYNNVLYFQC